MHWRVAARSKEGSGPVYGKEYHRVISFAPSITETLFALGLGDKVVGVTRYCNYPPQVKALPNIGGYVDPNFEMILSLRPDLVLILKEHSSLVDFLKKNRIEYRVIPNECYSEILQSFRTIGVIFGRQKQADTLIASIVSAASGSLPNKKAARVLLCIGRDNPGAGSISKVYIAGPPSFYNRLIELAGGVNAYSDSSFAYPSLSAEGIIRLSPDIIIDLMSSVSGIRQQQVKNDWKKLSMIDAVQDSLVFCPDGDYMTIPGPRMGLIIAFIKQTVSEFCRRNAK